jgi:hypothetical protein
MNIGDKAIFNENNENNENRDMQQLLQYFNIAAVWMHNYDLEHSSTTQAEGRISSDNMIENGHTESNRLIKLGNQVLGDILTNSLSENSCANDHLTMQEASTSTTKCKGKEVVSDSEPEIKFSDDGDLIHKELYTIKDTIEALQLYKEFINKYWKELRNSISQTRLALFTRPKGEIEEERQWWSSVVKGNLEKATALKQILEQCSQDIQKHPFDALEDCQAALVAFQESIGSKIACLEQDRKQFLKESVSYESNLIKNCENVQNKLQSSMDVIQENIIQEGAESSSSHLHDVPQAFLNLLNDKIRNILDQIQTRETRSKNTREHWKNLRGEVNVAAIDQWNQREQENIPDLVNELLTAKRTKWLSRNYLGKRKRFVEAAYKAIDKYHTTLMNRIDEALQAQNPASQEELQKVRKFVVAIHQNAQFEFKNNALNTNDWKDTPWRKSLEGYDPSIGRNERNEALTKLGTYLHMLCKTDQALSSFLGEENTSRANLELHQREGRQEVIDEVKNRSLWRRCQTLRHVAANVWVAVESTGLSGSECLRVFRGYIYALDI